MRVTTLSNIKVGMPFKVKNASLPTMVKQWRTTGKGYSFCVTQKDVKRDGAGANCVMIWDDTIVEAKDNSILDLALTKPLE